MVKSIEFIHRRKILGGGNLWYRIKSNNRYGYVYAGNGYTKVIKNTLVKKSKKVKSKASKKEDLTIKITTNYLNFRTSPWGKKIGVVSYGQIYRVYLSKKDSKGNVWYRIKSNNRYGYVYAGNGYTKVIKNTLVKISKSKKSKASKKEDLTIKITTNYLNFRTSPWGKKIGVVSYGQIYRVYLSKKDSKGNVWYRIKSNNRYGYVYAGNSYTKVIYKKNLADGWNKYGSRYYYVDKDGNVVRGWKVIGKTKYFFNEIGFMQTGWKKIGGRYYNFGKNGILKNGKNGQKNPNYITKIPGFYVSPMIADKNNTREERIEAMISTAKKYLGTTYKPCYAGRPGTYCDCSGLVMQGLYSAGYDPKPVSPKRHSLPAYEYESRNLWKDKRYKRVSYNDRRRGDLVFYHNGRGIVIHVGIYLGNNKIIEEWPPYGMIRPLHWGPRPYIKGFTRPFN